MVHIFYLILLTFMSSTSNFQVSGSLGVRETGDDFNNLSCDLCKVVMELLDAFITDEVTEEQVADFLSGVCSILPSPLDIECETMITEYTDDIIELIVNQYMRPDQVCEALSLCP